MFQGGSGKTAPKPAKNENKRQQWKRKIFIVCDNLTVITAQMYRMISDSNAVLLQLLLRILIPLA